ncbi:hypothetical protein D3C75_708920 [compost metagenome]
MSAAGSLSMISMDRPAIYCLQRILQKTRFIKRIRMDGNLDVILIRGLQTGIDCSRGASPILMQLETNRPGLNLLNKRFDKRRISLSGKTDIHRERLRSLQHTHHMPGTRRTRCCLCPCRRPCPSPDHGCNSRGQGRFNLLGTNKMHM